MSHSSGKPVSEVVGIDATFSDRFRDALTCDDNNNINKPDFRELDLGSPVSPLRTTRGPAASSSSSSSGSFSGRTGPTRKPESAQNNSNTNTHIHSNNNNSGELSGSSENSPTARKPGHTRSDSGSAPVPLIYSGQTATSPVMNVLPTGNICPSGKILKTGMTPNRSSRTSRSDVLGSGMGNYGHGSIMRGGGKAEPASTRGSGGGNEMVKRGGHVQSVDPEELKRLGNECYKRGNFVDALSLYDRAIAMSPASAAYRSNRAAALTGLGRLGEAVRECEEAVRLDPNYGRAHQRLASLFLR